MLSYHLGPQRKRKKTEKVKEAELLQETNTYEPIAKEKRKVKSKYNDSFDEIMEETTSSKRSRKLSKKFSTEDQSSAFDLQTQVVPTTSVYSMKHSQDEDVLAAAKKVFDEVVKDLSPDDINQFCSFISKTLKRGYAQAFGQVKSSLKQDPK